MLPFWGLVAVGIGFSVWHWRGHLDIAISAGATVFVGLLSIVAVVDLGFIGAGSRRYVEWLKSKRLSPAWNALRPSLMGIAFFYGIILGHFVWH